MLKRLLVLSILVGLTMMLTVSVGSAQDATAEATELPPVPVVALDNPYAAFLDSRNFAISKGATAEFRKLEWVALDKVNMKVYFAISNLAKGMSDDAGDIKMQENVCGAILMGELDANMNIASVTPVVFGGKYDEAAEADGCALDSIAGPDNLYVDPKGNLWIGEDTDDHTNNVLWMWNATTKELKRFATVPLGAEVTGLHITADGTLFMNVQHPDETDQAPYNMGTVGVIKGYVAGDDFTALPVPSTDDEKTKVMVAAGEYQVLARVGDAFPGGDDKNVFGAIIAHDGTVMDVCNDPDGNMFIPSGDNTASLYTNVECGVGGVAHLTLEKDATGTWKATSGSMVDFVPVDGTESNCGASVTAWGTGMTSEEYPPDNDEDWEYWLEEQQAGLTAYTGKEASPFDIGYNVELIPAADGTTTVAKHYAMGRFSKEVGVVMPDNKTVYFGDDGTDRVMFKFVADTANDLSAGTLYAAKVTQSDAVLGLEWIELGHGKDADIQAGLEALKAQMAS
jgi:secreted PhoX family phosphatase